MKKNLLLSFSSMLITLILFNSCQKDIRENEGTSVTDGNNSLAKNPDDESGCQLMNFDYGYGYTLDFKYNNKGLASEVLLRYSDGYFERHQIFYDMRGKLVKTRITSLDFPVILYDFSHTGDFITRANGYFEGTNEPWRDIRYSYNSNGQMNYLDDLVQDVHMKYFYNNQGYNTRGEFYLGADLFFTYDYEFKIPNRNPFLAVSGVPFGFWDFFLPLWDKRWLSSDHSVLYDNGTPIVVLDTDPDQTTMTTGHQNYLTSGTKYDRISESFYTESMIYQNCRGRNDDLSNSPSNFKKATGMNVITRIKKIINGHSKNMKQELKDLKKQYLGQLKPLTNK